MNQNPYESPSESERRSDDCVLHEEIHLSGAMTVRDLLHAQWLILSQRWIYAVICLGLYVLFVLALGLLNTRGSFFLLLGLIVMPALLPLTLTFVSLRLRREAQQQVGIFAFTETTLDSSGIRSTRDGKTISFSWSDFRSCLTSSQVALLFLTESNSHMIIARSKAASSEDWTTLVNYLRNRFGSP